MNVNRKNSTDFVRAEERQFFFVAVVVVVKREKATKGKTETFEDFFRDWCC